ncbi:MAG: hypothetical protein PHQ35_01675 [Phycisphaerae bacterium]|nr:hypothetical protein [Phycisphaerae bacterium]MDD5380356.1 hypothetical protein [Phycisphaerae bacterium]
MTVKKRRQMAASTLVEVMTAILITMVAITGSSFLFVFGKSDISLQKHYRAATYLAAQKLEELKAGDYASIPAGTTTDGPIALDDASYNRSVNTVSAGPYKEVTVTVSWLHGNKSRDVTIVTCIAP